MKSEPECSGLSVGGPTDARESLRCLRCKSRDMHRSGREAYRVVCAACGANYFAVMQLIPVEPGHATGIPAPEADRVGEGP